MSTHDCPSNPCPICGGPGFSDTLSCPSCASLRARAEKAEAEVEKLRYECNEYLKTRPELASVVEWENRYNEAHQHRLEAIKHSDRMSKRAEKAESERDAARAEVKRLREGLERLQRWGVDPHDHRHVFPYVSENGCYVLRDDIAALLKVSKGS